MKLPSEDADWYVVTVPGAASGIPAEALAAEELKAGGFETYMPWCRKGNFIRRQRLVREEHIPAMPGYLFVGARRGATVDWGHIRTNWRMRHVGRPIRVAGGFPLRIPAELVIQISVDEMNGAYDETGATKKANHQKLAERFRKGNMVRIEDGALIGFKALVEGVTAHDRVKALVEIFGRMATVEFMPEQLSAA